MIKTQPEEAATPIQTPVSYDDATSTLRDGDGETFAKVSEHVLHQDGYRIAKCINDHDSLRDELSTAIKERDAAIEREQKLENRLRDVIGVVECDQAANKRSGNVEHTYNTLLSNIRQALSDSKESK